ncbi:alpha/beta fold hydrolase [Kitasatospora sp. NPDC096147]|uniref:alpha/beta fold hydrolase n=1 Tax=Kitasatospora sp. NPDC096147 TaxID=3364093 RepID=UPI0038271A73
MTFGQGRVQGRRSEEGEEARFLRIGGRALHVRVSGQGPVVVLSGGLGCCWFDWDAVVPLLEPHRTVVRFDRPGHGLSELAPEPPTARGEADRIAALLDGLIREKVLTGDRAGTGAGGVTGGEAEAEAEAEAGAGAGGEAPAARGAAGTGSEPAAGAVGPVTVVGHSIAAFHVEAFARLYPERTAALVLLDGSTEPQARPAPARALRDLTARVTGTVLAAAGLPYLLGPLARRAVAAATTAAHRDPAPAESVRRCYRTGRMLRSVLAENTRYLDVAAELDVLRRTTPLRAPAVVLAAAARPDERWLGRQRELAVLLGAEYREVVPAGHLVMWDGPEAVAAAVLDAPSV